MNDQRSTSSSKCRQPSIKFSSTVCLIRCKGKDVNPPFSSSPGRGLPLGTQNENFLWILGQFFCLDLLPVYFQCKCKQQSLIQIIKFFLNCQQNRFLLSTFLRLYFQERGTFVWARSMFSCVLITYARVMTRPCSSMHDFQKYNYNNKIKLFHQFFVSL